MKHWSGLPAHPYPIMVGNVFVYFNMAHISVRPVRSGNPKVVTPFPMMLLILIGFLILTLKHYSSVHYGACHNVFGRVRDINFFHLRFLPLLFFVYRYIFHIFFHIFSPFVGLK
jgi:hypothetical protein